MNIFRALFILAFAAHLSGVAEAASPDLTGVLPRGGQRGKEITVTFTGNRLAAAQEVLFYETGISTKDLKPSEDGKKVTAVFVIAPEARLGEHQLRLRTAGGVSYVRSFWVGQFPSVAEKEPNNDFEEPQEIPFNSTIEGVALVEDVDYYRIQAKKGQRISIESEALRLGQMFDPYIAVLNQDRFEIAVSDDSALLRQDATLSFLAPEDGAYTIEVRDSAYQGSSRFLYRVHVGDYPRPTAIYPAGGKAGSEFEVTYLGDPRGPIVQKVKLDGKPGSTHEAFASQDKVSAPSPNILRVSALPDVLEKEPNNDTKSAQPTGLALPAAVNGILETEGDQDYFKVSAKKGQKFRIRVHAKSINSPVDPIFNVWGPDGKSIGGSDDADGSADSRYDLTAPADGEYVLRVRDMLLRGGPDFVYRIEAEAFTPALTLTMPEFERRNNQIRKAMVAHQGNRFATLVNVTRANFRGDVKLEVPGLPKGMTYKTGTVPASVSNFPIVFYAASDAPIGGKLTTLVGKSLDEKYPAECVYTQSVDFVRGNPNGAIYYESPNDQLPVAVAEPAPFKVDILPPAAPLVRNGLLPLTIKATRDEGFKAKITVRMLWRPPGVSYSSYATIAEGKDTVTYNLTANSSAETREWDIVVLAEADTPKGKVYVSSDYQKIKVDPSFLNGKFDLTTAEQGAKAQVLCKLEHEREFPGKAKVELLGLPAKATATPVEITKDSKEIKFNVAIADDTPKGQHKNLYCRITVQEGKASIPQSFAKGGVLRVDPKPEPEAAKTEAKPEQPAAKKEAPKKVATK